MYPFGLNFVHKNLAGQTHRQTDTHTHTHTNYSENITPPRFRGCVKNKNVRINEKECSLTQQI